jgi:site-specific recombinase XerD
MLSDFDGFKLYLLKDKRCRNNTVKRRVWNLRHIVEELGSLENITTETVDEYTFRLLQANKKATYINSLLDTVRSYGDWKKIDSLCHIKNIKEDAPVKSILSDEEVEAILALPCPQRRVVSKFGKVFTRSIGQRNWDSQTMFFTLLAYTGCRPNEVAKLNKHNDILWGQDLISIKNDKTGKNRLIPIASNIKQPLKDYCEGLDSEFLFKTNNATGFINSSAWCDAFHKRLKRAGIVRRQGLTVYSLRHSFITNLLEEDVAFPRVMQLAGHSRAETTLRYTHLCVKNLRTAVDKLPLVQGHKNASEKIHQFMLTVQKFQAENRDIECSVCEKEGHLIVDMASKIEPVASTLPTNPLQSS